MTLGFIIIRHVSSKISDLFWKESYNCIRKYYDNPIMIIDDSSNKDFLNENIILENCNVIYDTEHKGSAELLPYYYFHKLQPFDTAVIIHDSVFIQSKIDFNLKDNENIRFLWNFPHWYDDDLFDIIREQCTGLKEDTTVIDFFHKKDLWLGCFGVMSIIKWNFLNMINERHNLFNVLLPKMNNKSNRYGLERSFALIVCLNEPIVYTQFGDRYAYMQNVPSFIEYLTQDYSSYPIIKAWAGR